MALLIALFCVLIDGAFPGLLRLLLISTLLVLRWCLIGRLLVLLAGCILLLGLLALLIASFLLLTGLVLQILLVIHLCATPLYN